MTLIYHGYLYPNDSFYTYHIPFMKLPSFLFDQATIIRRPTMITEQANFIAAQVQATTLNFVNAIQEQTNWCWAGVSSAVSVYYNPNSTWSQCSIASAQLQQDCCANPRACNVYGYLDGALTTTGNYQGLGQAPASSGYLQAQLNNSSPVCIRVAWNGGGAHFITLYGIDLAGIVYVADPWYGISTQVYAGFPSGYQGGATWTHTFLTK